MSLTHSNHHVRRIITKGQLRYDPEPVCSKKAAQSRSLVVLLERDDLDLYYQWFITRQHGLALKLQRPMFGMHVTVVRNDEQVLHPEYWGKYEGAEVEIEYDTVVRNHTVFWSLPVYNEALQVIRSELGLPAERDFHITVGRQYDWQPIPEKARFEAWELRRMREEQEMSNRF